MQRKFEGENRSATRRFDVIYLGFIETPITVVSARTIRTFFRLLGHAGQHQQLLQFIAQSISRFTGLDDILGFQRHHFNGAAAVRKLTLDIVICVQRFRRFMARRCYPPVFESNARVLTEHQVQIADRNVANIVQCPSFADFLCGFVVDQRPIGITVLVSVSQIAFLVAATVQTVYVPSSIVSFATTIVNRQISLDAIRHDYDWFAARQQRRRRR